MVETLLIAGLGNPGSQYTHTRHNIGFMVTDLLAERWGITFCEANSFDAELVSTNIQDKKVYLCQPMTFMNLSGKAISALMRYYKIAADQVLIILDDANLPLGTIRLRPAGGTGGHHGLESVIDHIGTNSIARLRVGIGDAGKTQITSHVLGKFQANELSCLEASLQRAADQAECWVKQGLQRAMNEFNGAVCPVEKEN